METTMSPAVSRRIGFFNHFDFLNHLFVGCLPIRFLQSFFCFANYCLPCRSRLIQPSPASPPGDCGGCRGERAREREREIYIYIYVYMYTHTCTHTHTHINDSHTYYSKKKKSRTCTKIAV